MHVGENWAFQGLKKPDLAEVRVLAIGEKRPLRIKVAFLGDEFEGATEWVSPARLKILWSERQEFIDREHAWYQLRLPTEQMPKDEDAAVDHVFLKWIDESIAERFYNHGNQGITAVYDRRALARLCGLEEDEISDPVAFIEDDALLVPWTVTRAVASAFALHNSAQVLVRLEDAERKQLEEVASGRIYRGRGGGHDIYIDPESCAESYDKYFAPMARVLRSWCSDAAIEDRREVDRLRTELSRLTVILNSTVADLKNSGDTDGAWKLHSALYPGMSRNRWKSVAEIQFEYDARVEATRKQMWEDAAEQRWSRMREADAKAERYRAELFGYDAPEWALEEP